MNMTHSKKNVKNNVLPHSQAKLDLYRNYLEHYLRILSLAPFCSRINLYDIFCGVGLYDDGNLGSPLIAKECIKDVHSLLDTLKRPIKPIVLSVNDKEPEKIENVRLLLERESLRNCSYRFFNEEADSMLDKVAKEVNSLSTSERNLIFIDPYGYSQIDKEKIHTILKNECSEVILFLPVMQMYRFTGTALTYTERTCYENLRKFIFSFFHPEHKIHTDGIQDIFEYIQEIKAALSFDGKFYTSSHYIEREKGNYYALFFISSNIYGLEKMLEAKWKMDPVKGKGFDQKNTKSQTSMFQNEFEEHDKRKELDYLANIIRKEIKLKGSLNNNDIYRLSVLNEFRPTHANTVMKQLLKNVIKAEYPSNRETNVLTGFGINYDNYKNGEVKIIFSNQ
jgi:three-Cys-motif partner protein